MNEDLKITKEDLVLWLDRPPSNDDLDLCSYLSNAVENQYKYYQENKQLKEKLDIENINYKTLSADIGTVAEYMKLDEYAIIEEMIDRAVELVKKENIIDELEKWLEENKYFYSGLQGEDLEEDTTIIEVLDKLQELKGSDKNV